VIEQESNVLFVMASPGPVSNRGKKGEKKGLLCRSLKMDGGERREVL